MQSFFPLIVDNSLSMWFFCDNTSAKLLTLIRKLSLDNHNNLSKAKNYSHFDKQELELNQALTLNK